MRKRIILILPLVIAGAAIISFAGDKPVEKPAAAPEIGEMRSEISDLRARVQALQDRVKGLESTVAQMRQPHLMPLIAPEPNSSLLNPPAIDSKPPRIWGEREINGWRLYIVPCDQKTP